MNPPPKPANVENSLIESDDDDDDEGNGGNHRFLNCHMSAHKMD